MGDKNPIHTLGDYSRPSHEGYRNTIDLLEGNNVVPLRSDTIRLVQNGFSFHGLRSEDPNQHLKDFLKLMDSLDLDVANMEKTRLRLFQFSLCDQSSNWLECLPARSSSTWEDLTNCFLAQFFPPGRTSKLQNDILMFQQHQVPHQCEIDRVVGGKLRDMNAKESWEIIENLTLYNHEGWDDPRDFAKLKEKSVENNKVVNKNIVEISKLDIVELIELVDREEEMKDRTDDESARSTKEELTELTNEKPIGTDIRLSLASHSYIYPIGIAVDVLVEIAGYVYPVDFVILDIKEDEKNPFILGMPFLATDKAEIRFDKGTITLRSIKNKINFFKIPESPCRVKEETENDIDLVALTITVIFDDEKPRSSLEFHVDDSWMTI
ncbi:MAK10-like protein [Tanacetum coccineum]